MNFQPPKTPRCGHILHTDYAFDVLVNHQPRPTQRNYARIMCEALPVGQAIAAFISPIHAMISAAHSAEPPLIFYRRIAIESFDPREFIKANGGELRFSFHCGFAARNGKIGIRKNGDLCAVSPCQIARIEDSDIDDIRFKVDTETVEAVKRVYEYAGLFAYQETHAASRRWSPQRCDQEVFAAVQGIPGTVDSSVEFNQIAIYDPEFRHWHFVPLSEFCEEQGKQ